MAYGLVQKRRNSIAKALELRLSCTKPIDMKAIEIVIEWIVVIGEMGSRTYRWLSGKLWYLQHSCVGDTIVYH